MVFWGRERSSLPGLENAEEGILDAARFIRVGVVGVEGLSA